jgi:peptide-methionine (S)-S-oxide reductase
MTDTNTQPLAGKEWATLGGGCCFWCLDAVCADLQDVESVKSGYTGGGTVNPTYEQVCNGTSGHAEVARVTFDPKAISFRDVLGVFFAIHDPTTLNRQGNDIGTQYRSAIFYHSIEQKREAEKVIAQVTAEKRFHDPIVTEVALAQEFYSAEKYHQQYFANNSLQPYCELVVGPKVAKYKKQFADRVKRS